MDLRNRNGNFLRLLLIIGVVAVVFPIAFCGESAEMKRLGAPRVISQNGGEVDSLGRFAVQQHNNKQNGGLEFVRVVKATEQVVAGTLYDLFLEAVDGGKKKMYEANVWVKPWMSYKELHEFKEASDNNPSFTTSDLGVKHGR